MASASAGSVGRANRSRPQRSASRRGRCDPMLGTRILTAAFLISVVLAALFLLAPVGWGTVSLLVVGIAASEWANLAGYEKKARALFVVATLVIGILLLVSLAAGDASRWTDVVLATCGAATLFWVFIAPPWLAFHWKPTSRVA